MNNLSRIKGIGTKNLLLLNNLNIFYIEDMINYYPYRHDLISFQNIKEVVDKSNIIVSCKVDSVPIFRAFRNKMNSLTFRAYANNKMFNIIIFNRLFLKKHIVPGKTITVFGKWDEIKNTLTASDIRFDNIENNSIEGVYHLTAGLTNKIFRKFMQSALDLNITVEDIVPQYLNEKYKLISKMEAVKKIHAPKDINDVKKALVKLKYEELFEFMFKINYLKKVNKEIKKSYKRKVDKGLVNEFIRSFPFELTADQNKVVNEIYEDLTSEYRMNRMIQGDVGSGKTIVGVIGCYVNFLAGFQSALMAPTEILATQHYETIKNILMGTEMKIELLTGSTKKKDKEVIYESLKNGDIDLLIGTHAIISDGVEFKNLGLVITDEQHRFGVNQRTNLKNKGIFADTLYMSATPIPRTFALTLYGDMDISNIKTKPKGRKDIETIIKSEKEIEGVYKLMEDEINNKHQIFVISPLIEETETLDLTTVNNLKSQIDEYFGKKVKTSIMHGKLSKKDKDEIMEDFKSGKIDVLISTTVIEVGIDIKNATMMVIFDAERFGLATLHQLRGRIGRNELDCKCILIGDEKNKRLKVLSESNDGFYITEKDYENRGEGDLFGIKQSGDMVFKISDIHKDFKILLQAKEDSEEFLKENIKNDFKDYDYYRIIVNNIGNLD